MKIFKGAALGLLSFLLFLSLTVFGLAFMVNGTALNPDFVTAELERLDVSSLTREIISQQIPADEPSKDIMDALVNNIAQLEPLVTEQVNAAIRSVYDYLLDKSEELDLAQTLKNTILSTDFITSLINEFDIPHLVEDYLREQVMIEILTAAGYLPENIDQHLVDAIAERESWLKEQAATATGPIVDYLLGESRSLRIVIPLKPVKNSLRDKLWLAFRELPAEKIAGIPSNNLEPYFDQLFQAFARGIPETYELDESLLGTKIPARIDDALTEAEERLGQAKRHIGSFRLGYGLLIGFTVVLIVSLIVLNRRVKKATRSLGIIFFSYGALEYAGVYLARHFINQEIVWSEITSPTFQAWRPHFFDVLLAPLEFFSLGLLIGGVALVIVSFIYRPRHSGS